MKILIVFIGLIVQVNQPRSLLNTAALPSGGSQHPHEARLEIPYEMIENPDASLRESVRNGYAVIDIEGVHVTVVGTKGWFSRMSDDLQDSLPPLRKLNSGCRLRKEVIDRTPTEALYSFIDFRGGRRTVYNYLEDRLEFDEWEGCASCSVAYEADLDGPVATLRLEGKGPAREIRVKADAEIFVKNTPKHPMQNHFRLLYGVYEGCTKSTVIASIGDVCDKNPQCKSGTIVGSGPTAPGADCTGGNG